MLGRCPFLWRLNNLVEGPDDMGFDELVKMCATANVTTKIVDDN